MKTHIRPRNARVFAIGRSRGMTLIEVLVTLVIISVGLLGVAALQLTTVRNNYDAFVRSQAAVLASDILDRIRANRAAAMTGAGAYNTDFGDVTSTTNPAATADMTQWKAMLNAQLPNGDGSIVTNTVNVAGVDRRIVTITIRWGERSTVVANQQVTFVTSSQI